MNDTFPDNCALTASLFEGFIVLADNAASQNDFKKARIMHKEARCAIKDKTERKLWMAALAVSLARLHATKARLKRAVFLYKQAIGLLEESRSEVASARVVLELGRIQLVNSRYQAARRTCQAAIRKIQVLNRQQRRSLHLSLALLAYELNESGQSELATQLLLLIPGDS
jgi:hypothetical protein